MPYNYKDQTTGNQCSDLFTTEQILTQFIADKDSPLQFKIEELRQFNKGTEQYNNIKSSLPTFYFNCRYKTPLVSPSNIFDLTNDIYLDIDDIPSEDELLLKQKQISLLPFVKACYKSCGGKGLGIIVSIKEGIITLDNFKAVFDYMNATYFNMELDTNITNITRQNSISFDPNAFINLNCIPLAIKEVCLAKAKAKAPIRNNIRKGKKGLYVANDNDCLNMLLNVDISKEKLVNLQYSKHFVNDEEITFTNELFGTKYVLVENYKVSIPSLGLYKIKQGKRHKVINMMCRILIYLNQEVCAKEIFCHVMHYNNQICYRPLGKLEVAKIVDYWIRVKDSGNLLKVKGKKQSMIINPKLPLREKKACAQIASSIVRKDNSRVKMRELIEELHNEGIVLTLNSMANAGKLGRATIQKYFKEFKEEIDSYNQLLKKQNGTKSKSSTINGEGDRSDNSSLNRKSSINKGNVKGRAYSSVDSNIISFIEICLCVKSLPSWWGFIKNKNNNDLITPNILYQIMKHCELKIPTSLSVELNNSTLSTKHKEVCCDLYYIITSKIDQYDLNAETLFPLQSTVLAARYGNDYTTPIKWLKENNFISCDNKSIRSKNGTGKSYCYGLGIRIINDIDNNHLSIYPYVKSFYFKKPSNKASLQAISQISKVNIFSQKKTGKKDKTIIKTTNQILKKLEADWSGAFDFVNKMIDVTREQKISKNIAENCLLKIRDGVLTAKRNETNYRLNTNITNLKSELLQFFTLDGDNIKSIDLSNSQLSFFLSTLYAVQKKDIKLIAPNELRRFANIVESGTFWDFFGDKLGIDPIKDRKQLKGIVFEFFYNHECSRCTARTAFKKHFPTIERWISNYKKQFGYKQFSISMQLLESNLFIDIILRRLLNEGYKVLTKHDSFLCKENDFNMVNLIVREELDKYFGENKYNVKIEDITVVVKEEITVETKVKKKYKSRLREIPKLTLNRLATLVKLVDNSRIEEVQTKTNADYLREHFEKREKQLKINDK